MVATCHQIYIATSEYIGQIIDRAIVNCNIVHRSRDSQLQHCIARLAADARNGLGIADVEQMCLDYVVPRQLCPFARLYVYSGPDAASDSKEVQTTRLFYNAIHNSDVDAVRNFLNQQRKVDSWHWMSLQYHDPLQWSALHMAVWDPVPPPSSIFHESGSSETETLNSHTGHYVCMEHRYCLRLTDSSERCTWSDSTGGTGHVGLGCTICPRPGRAHNTTSTKASAYVWSCCGQGEFDVACKPAEGKNKMKRAIPSLVQKVK
eukprot:g19148.t1